MTEKIRMIPTEELIRSTLEIDCFLSLEEAKDIEYVRQSGNFNMITQGRDVAQFLVDSGCNAGYAWLLRCQEHQLSPMIMWGRWIGTMEKMYGPQDTWLKKKDINRRKRAYLKNSIQQAKFHLAQLKNQKNEL